MAEDAKERGKWKVRLAGWLDGAASLVTKPVQQMMVEVTHGILASGSLRQAEIGRQLKEPMALHHTQKRLSRMLGKHGEVAGAAEQVQLSRIGPWVGDRMILALDPGDLNRDGAPKSEFRSRVRDGDNGEIVGGYPLMSVVARDLEDGTTLPLLTRLQSNEHPDYSSENSEILAVMREVQAAITASPLWVLDRGGDRGRLWDVWLKEKWPVLVRAANQRHWLWRGMEKPAQDIAKHLPMKHKGRLRRGKDQKVGFGITRVRLREQPDTRLFMVVVRHGKQEPLVLVTTHPVRGRRQGERLMQAYMDRWACEEGYRFTKQGFDLEGVQARRFTTLRNLIALASLAWALLAGYQENGHVLLARAKRQKTRQFPRFPFYSLLQGWKALFAEARWIFYHWWRKAVPQSPTPNPTLPGLFTGLAGTPAKLGRA